MLAPKRFHFDEFDIQADDVEDDVYNVHASIISYNTVLKFDILHP